MSDAKLADKTQRALIGAGRDVAVITPFGWDEERIEDLAEKRLAFLEMPDDTELSGMMMEATAAKKAARKAATDFCAKEIVLRVSIRYGEKSPTMNRLKGGQLHTATDLEFQQVIRRIRRQATQLLPNLTVQGLTEAHLTTLSELITNYENASEAQQAAIENRDKAVEDRINLGNELYAELVELCEIGKRLHLNVSESSYNDYVLYPNSGDTEPEPQQEFENDVNTESVLNLSATGIDGTEAITAQNTGTVPLIIYFAAQPTDLPESSVGPLAAGAEATGTTAEVGFVAGSKEYLNVYNPSTDTVGSIAITISG